MSELVYLDLKKTTLSTTVPIFSVMIAYSLAKKNMVHAECLIATLIFLVLVIYTLYLVEIQRKKVDIG